MKEKFAAQLYTVREELKQDFPGVLRELAAMGYAGVQISGLQGWDAEVIAATLKETGLKTAGMHVGLDQLRNELPELLRQADLFGTKDLVCPFLPQNFWNEEGYRAVKAELNAIAREIAPKGYRLSYHNHAFEFETMVDGQDALAFLLEPTAENLILAEIDVYWVTKGGRDPVEYIKPYAGRMPLLHLKDMTNDEERAFAEVGTGLVNFPPILAWGEESGVEWYCVEQDKCKGAPMESLRLSLNNLLKMAGER